MEKEIFVNRGYQEKSYAADVLIFSKDDTSSIRFKDNHNNHYRDGKLSGWDFAIIPVGGKYQILKSNSEVAKRIDFKIIDDSVLSPSVEFVFERYIITNISEEVEAKIMLQSILDWSNIEVEEV